MAPAREDMTAGNSGFIVEKRFSCDGTFLRPVRFPE
jgi:hypothetical protein